MPNVHLTDKGPMPCKAKTVETCRAKYSDKPSPHFSDSAAAQREFERDLGAEHGVVSQPVRKKAAAAKKNTSPAPAESPQAESPQKTTTAPSPTATHDDPRTAALRSVMSDASRADGTYWNTIESGYSMKGIYPEEEYPGCDGCLGHGSEPCRCRIYYDYVNISKQDAAIGYYNSIVDEEHHISAYSTKNPAATLPKEKAEAYKAVYRTLQKHGIFDSDNYSVNTSPGYYGQELEGVTIYADHRRVDQDIRDIFDGKGDDD